MAREKKKRRCLVTGDLLPFHALLRFVADPGARLLPDLQNRLSGRGMWVLARRSYVAKALVKKLFERAHGAPLSVAEDLPDRLETLLREAALSSLGIAARGGQILYGEEAALRAASDKTSLLRLRAASPETRRFARFSGSPYLYLFSDQEMAAALGRSALRRLALRQSPAAPAARPALFALARYARYLELTGVPETAAEKEGGF